MTDARIGFHVSAWGSDHILAALHCMGKAGFEGIETYADVSHIFADKPTDFADILEIADVAFAGIHSGGTLTQPEFHEAEIAEWTRLLEWARAAGAEYAVYYGGDVHEDEASDLGHAAALLNRIGKLAADVGIGFAYEPDRRCPFNSRERITALADATDPTLLGLAADTAKLTQMGLDPSMFLLSRKARIGVVHMRDLKRPDDGRVTGDEFTDPGGGTVDLVSVGDTLRMIGYSGWVVGVVDRPQMSAFHSAMATASYFRDELHLMP